MATKHIELQGIGNVTLYKRRGNRSLRLSIGAGGEVRVSMPYWLPYRAGEQFAMTKLRWIEANRQRATTILLQSGQSIGKAHRLYFEPQPLGDRVQTRIASNEIKISVPSSTAIHTPHVQQAAHKASIRALRKEAETLLPQRLRLLSRQTGLEYTSVSVKQLKSRWGSCSSRKEITLNLFLMQLPWHLIDYVLVHELTHTKVMHHGQPFWQELEHHVPQAKQLRKEIGSYRPVLTPR